MNPCRHSSTFQVTHPASKESVSHMVLKLPPTFDVFAEALDPFEKIIRDQLAVKIVNWAKFRYTINVGNSAVNLRSVAESISPQVEESYRELAKSHYEVVTSLGSVRLSLQAAAQAAHSHPLLFKKSFKDFYFHIGCVLDNLARLIYLVNDPQSASATYAKGALKGKLVRHWIDWGRLPAYPGYTRLKRSIILREIINIRNAFTHGWSCPIFQDKNSGILCWPIAIRTQRDFYWPFDEISTLKRKYRKAMPILQMMEQDFDFIERFQDRAFARLVKDVGRFEKNYSVTIH
jgi:hypothetical protein